LAADGCIGAAIGLWGLDELAPLGCGPTAFVTGYALIFSLAINDRIKLALLSHFSKGEPPA
jgi:hypothetical protein